MKDLINSIQTHTNAQAKYDKGNTIDLYMKLNIHTKADIIHWTQSQCSKQDAVKKPIGEEISKKGAPPPKPSYNIYIVHRPACYGDLFSDTFDSI